ncbi:MAG: hypothetical protein AAGF27_06135 [Pseudomonadota bacterium]
MRAEITDLKSAEAWLETQDHRTHIWFAARAAQRELPKLSEWEDSTESGLALDVLRALLVAATAADSHGRLPSSLLQAASSALNHLGPSEKAHDARSQNLFAASALHAANASYAALASVLYSISSAEALDFAQGGLEIRAAQEDAANPRNWGPLWPNGGPPKWETDSWQQLRDQWSDHTGQWSFWIEWYERILDGNPMDWSLIFKIATEISDEDWEAGQARVAERIEEIRSGGETDKKSDGTDPLPAPSQAEKVSTAAQVAQNREAIALAVAGVLEQISEYRERVRGLNGLELEYREDLLQFIDKLSAKLEELLAYLPEEETPISPEEGGKFIQWLRECRALIPGVAKRYAAPENVVEAGVPVSIILGCTSVGAMIGGPVGAGAGGVVGSLITNQIKPRQAAEALLERPAAPPEN